MFIRKLLKPNNTTQEQRNAPAGMQTMDSSLQRMFSRGVQYNMKIIIKGDRNVGKSCLFLRLQGQKFKEQYDPTDEIQVANIQWNYKTLDDIVKVEVWDIVDKGKKKKLDGLKLDNSVDKITCDPSLDADFIDVYKNTHGVIMIMDMTKQWTFDYLQKELPKVPYNIPILVLVNHRDMRHHRTVTDDQIRTFLEHLPRPDDASPICYSESSMKNSFGLKYVHKFFNIPFLYLQRETLQEQLKRNTLEINVTLEELDLHDDQENSDDVSGLITSWHKQQKTGAATSVTGSKLEASNDAVSKPAYSKFPQSASASVICSSVVNSSELSSTSHQKSISTSTSVGLDLSSHKPTDVPVARIKSLEDFSPDEPFDNSFLDDITTTADAKPTSVLPDSDNETTGNPFVVEYQVDLDTEDEVNEANKSAESSDEPSPASGDHSSEKISNEEISQLPAITLESTDLDFLEQCTTATSISATVIETVRVMESPVMKTKKASDDLSRHRQHNDLSTERKHSKKHSSKSQQSSHSKVSEERKSKHHKKKSRQPSKKPAEFFGGEALDTQAGVYESL